MEYLHYWPACLRSRWQDIDQVLLFVFGNTINNTVQNLHTLLVHSAKFFLAWIQEGTLKQASAHLPHLDSQLEQRIKFRMERIMWLLLIPYILLFLTILTHPPTPPFHITADQLTFVINRFQVCQLTVLFIEICGFLSWSFHFNVILRFLIHWVVN